MRRWTTVGLALAWILVIGTHAGAQRGQPPRAERDQSGREETEQFSRTVRLGANGRFTLDNVAGSITVTGGSGNDVTIEAVKRTRGDRSNLDDVTIQVDERSGSVAVESVYRRTNDRRERDRMTWVDYTIGVPAGTDTEIRSASGSITVTGVQGPLRAETASGNVTARRVDNVEELRSVSGRVSLEEARIDRRAELSVVSGEVTVRDVTGSTLGVKAISGRIRLENVAADRLDGSVISGSIELMGRVSERGRYDLSTHSGPVRVTLASTAEFELDAATLSGSIRSDFEGRTVTSSERRRMERRLNATIGRGGTRLSLRTSSGSIEVTKR